MCEGEALSIVAIDKLPFASPDDPLLKARLEGIRRRGGNPFFEYQLPQAVLALKQGVGRLIRDFEDFGVIVIGDPRLKTKPYGRVFLQALPPSPVITEGAVGRAVPRRAIAALARCAGASRAPGRLLACGCSRSTPQPRLLRGAAHGSRASAVDGPKWVGAMRSRFSAWSRPSWRKAGVSLSMLDGIAASVGPGAFTGVRISVAVAQGLAFGADLPVVPITTLEALALQAMDEGAPIRRLRAWMRAWARCTGAASRADCGARRGALRRPQRGRPRAGEVPGRRAAIRGIGRGFAAYPELATLAGIDPQVLADALPDARHMARLGALRLAAGEGMDPADLQPQYLRDKVALTEEERAARDRGGRDRSAVK